MRELVVGVVLFVWVAAAGCGPHGTPYRVGDLREDSSSRAWRPLVHYLAQNGADPSVCDRQAPEFAIRSFTARDAGKFVSALSKGRVPPATWRACAEHLVADLSPDVASRLVEHAAEALVEAVEAGDADAAALARAEALEAVVANRPRSLRVTTEVESALRAAIDSGAGSGAVRAVGARMLEALELDRGYLQGAPLDRARIGTIEDRTALRRIVDRVHDAGLRDAALERYVDLTIAASSIPEVLADAAGTRARVLRTGRNAIPRELLSSARVSSAQRAADFVVVAEQDVPAQTVTFTARRSGAAEIVPIVSLRGVLLFEVPGYGAPLTFCAPARELAVEPCIESGALALGSPVARLDDDGVVHFRDHMPIRQAAPVLEGNRLPLPILLSESTLAPLEAALFLAPPEPLVFARGEAIGVSIAPAGLRLAAQVQAEGATATLLVFFEPDHVGRHGFRVASQGVRGSAGANGLPGMRGMNGGRGHRGSCPYGRGSNGQNGHAGGRGGNGQRGGPGGPGGDVRVIVHCAPESCDAALQLGRTLAVSRGGPGGPGGMGGRGGEGGRGGDGGPGDSCTDASGQRRTVPAGSRGSDGMRGPNGMNGPPGPDGPPGRVTVEVAH